MIKDTMKMSGLVTAHLIKADGTEITEQANMVVDAGKGWVANRMVDIDNVMSHMGLGASSTAAAVGQTDLVDEAGDYSSYTRETCPGAANPSAKTVTYTATWIAGQATTDGSLLIREAGIFDTDSVGSGTMLARTVFTGDITKDASDVLTVTWVITIA